jgi:hypothetical protein
MNRHDTISNALMRPPHPRFKPLSYARFITISKIKAKIGEEHQSDIGHLTTAISWVICTHDPETPGLQSAIESEDPVKAFEPFWIDSLHVSEVAAFNEWYEREFQATEAAATIAKPEGVGKKPSVSEEQTPTT